MKINETKRGSVGGTGKIGNSSATRQAPKAGENQSDAVEKSGVNVSSNGSIATTLASDAAGRSDKVTSLKMEVTSGTYEPDSQKTADKILADLTDYSLA